MFGTGLKHGSTCNGLTIDFCSQLSTKFTVKQILYFFSDLDLNVNKSSAVAEKMGALCPFLAELDPV